MSGSRHHGDIRGDEIADPALDGIASTARAATAFSGTASYYLRYRPPYPDEFLSDLRSHAKTTGFGSLLDLACGPGRVAIPMAPYFVSVLAIDVEAEMIAAGAKEASRRGVT